MSFLGPWTNLERGEIIEAVDRSHYRDLLISGDSVGRIRLYKYPASKDQVRLSRTTVTSAYKKPAYNKLLVIRNWFLFPNLNTSLVRYTFIRNSGYKEHIFLVPMSSL